MALEIIGSLYKVLPEQTGMGKNGSWVKQNFVIETDDKYPKKICVTAWGEVADDIKNYRMGDRLKIAIDLESREYQDKWYSDIKAFRIEKFAPGNAKSQQPVGGHDAPFDERDYARATSVQEPGQADDLPF